MSLTSRPPSLPLSPIKHHRIIDRTFMPIPHSLEPAKHYDERFVRSDSSISQICCKSHVDPHPSETSEQNENATKASVCTDRAELIERIKRGESPTWLPNATLHEEYLKERCHPSNGPAHNSPLNSDVLDNGSCAKQSEHELASPSDLERPRSALHAGDFQDVLRLDEVSQWTGTLKPQQPGLAFGASWAPSSSSTPAPLDYELPRQWPKESCPSDYSPALGPISSNYVLKIPTTPLVQQFNNRDNESPSPNRDRSASPEKANRRHTLPAHARRDWQSQTANNAPPTPRDGFGLGLYRQEPGVSRCHKPNRSVTSVYSLQQPATPLNPTARSSRRTSFSSEASSRHRASMVGSYEESILHGRMSTPPSKPFDFTAHIGALGRGTKPKMPAHVTVPFQAVFYDWTSQGFGNSISSEPSPYVGFIDLRNMHETMTRHEEVDGSLGETNELVDSHTQDTHDRVPGDASKKRKRHSSSSLKAPSGGYRIPAQGHVQVVVKNPYKTALKLFLVPYDLTGMEPGQKTFVRQRYYSSGPMLERPLASETRSTANPSRVLNKSTLRYLIHLKMCCPSKGKFFVYDQIRVVFANRVPDDKEHLTKEAQEPNPKYSLWKPQNEPTQLSPGSSRPSKDVEFRRRSSGPLFDGAAAGMRRSVSHTGQTGQSLPYTSTDIPPVPPIPFHLPPPKSAVTGRETHRGHDMPHAAPQQHRPWMSPGSGMEEGLHRSEQLSSDSGDSDTYMKLQRGEAGYGGFPGYGGTPESGEGLLTRRLRSLEVQQGRREDWDRIENFL